MKIGIDGRALQDQPWGGVGQYTYHLLHALFGLDWENEYHVFYNAFDIQRSDLRRNGDRISPYPTFSEYQNVHIHRKRWPNKLFNLSMKALHAPKLEIGNSKLDILLMPNLNFVALSSSTKLIAIAHDLSFVHFPEHFPLKTRIWHRAVNPRALFARANHVIAVSEHTRDDLVETYGIAPEKVTVVYPGVDIRYSKLDISGQRISNIQYPISAPYILYFGALEPRKNIVGIIEAYELLHRGRSDLRRNGDRISRYQLVIAGLSTSYTRRLKERIEKSPLNKQIKLIENSSEEQKHALYTDATIFVYPSFYEGFGFPPLEAMAHGVPVVASSASSVPEVCGDAALLVSPWKVEEIAAGMRVLLEDQEVRARYIEAGRRRVQEFSWPRCAQQVRNVLKGFINS